MARKSKPQPKTTYLVQTSDGDVLVTGEYINEAELFEDLTYEMMGHDSSDFRQIEIYKLVKRGNFECRFIEEQSDK